MKTFNLAFLLICLISFSVQKDYEENYFNGNWDATGYRCTDNRQPPIEKVNCVTTNGQAICTKTLGDNCVTTGHETFRVKAEPTFSDAKSYRITYVVGNPGRPNSGHLKNQYKTNILAPQSRPRTIPEPFRITSKFSLRSQLVFG